MTKPLPASLQGQFVLGTPMTTVKVTATARSHSQARTKAEVKGTAAGKPPKANQRQGQRAARLDHKVLAGNLAQVLRAEQLSCRQHDAASRCVLAPVRPVQRQGLACGTVLGFEGFDDSGIP